MANIDRPDIVIIPGSYTPATFFVEFKYALRNLGFTVHLTDLPSASGAPSLPPASLATDASHFRSIISNLVQQNKQVVIFAHSYGGLVAREVVASSKLDAASCQADGSLGGITRIIYLSAMLSTPPDSSLQFFQNYAAHLPWLAANITDVVDPETEGGPQYVRQNPIKAAPFFFNDLPDAEAIKWTVRMSMHTMSAWMSQTSVLQEASRRIPITYIRCLQDAVFPLAFQDEMIKLLAKEQKSVDETLEIDVRDIDSAHFAPVTCTDMLAQTIMETYQ